MKTKNSRIVEHDNWQQLASPNISEMKRVLRTTSKVSGAVVLFVGLLYTAALAMLWWGASWKVAVGGFLLIWASNTERRAIKKFKR